MTALRIFDIDIDLDRICVKQGETEIHLTPSEFRALAHLAQNPNRVVAHRELYDAMRRRDLVEAEDRAVADHVKVVVRRLRRKLGADTIRNVRGFGYILDTERQP